MSPRRRVSLIIICLMTLIAGAGAIRCAPFPDVFTPRGVLLYGNDSYYHLRRITYGVDRLPEALREDPYLHYPRGARAIWPLAFDQGSAALIRALGVPDDRPSILAAAAFGPPILGMLAVLMAFLASWRALSSPVAGLLAAACVACFGANVHPTRIGFVDHHATMAALVGLVSIAGAEMRSEASRWRSRLAALWLGMALGASALIWPGCLVLLFAWAITLALSIGIGGGRRIVWTAGVQVSCAAALVLAMGAIYEARPPEQRWSWTLVSWLQPVAVLAVGGIAAAIWIGMGRDERKLRGFGFGLIAAVLLGGAALLAPPVRSAAEDAMRWVTKSESFQARVAESEPILFQKGGWTLKAAHGDLGWLAVLLPLAGAAVLWAGLRERAFARLLLASIFFSTLVLTLFQRRFVDLLALPAALVLADGLARWAAMLRSRWRGAPVVLSIALAVSLVPCLEIPWFHLGRALTALEGERPQPLASDIPRRQLRRTGQWIHEHTPPTKGWQDPGEEPEYGIAAFWDLGHLLRFHSRRPMMVDNFGDDLGERSFEDSMRLHRARSEAEAVEILARYRARYWVTRELPRVRSGRRRVADRLHRFDGRVVRTTDGGALPALERFRLVHESLSVPSIFVPPTGKRKIYPAYKVWELVAGARLTGVALPEERVRVEVSLETSSGRRFRFRKGTTSDSEGRFEIVVPYPTETEPHHVRATGPYRISGESFETSSEVSIADVRAGRFIRVDTHD
ncbi:MAG: STT3 domain-containing protein [Planctomycetota bacterium]